MAIGKVNTGGSGSGGTLTVNAPAGVTVTAAKDGKTYTRTANAEGVAVFKGLATGVWTVTITTAGELPSAQDVLITADYAVTLAFFRALVDVTYPAGSQCICTDGDITLTATDTSGHMVFNIQRVGRWYIRCTDGSQETERYVDVTATGQSFTITMAYFAATINVTYPAGSNCNCKNADESIVMDAPDQSGVVTFTVPSAGDWTVSCTDGTDTADQTVTITQDGQSESVELSYTIYLINVSPVNDDITGGWTAIGKKINSQSSVSAGAPVVTQYNDHIVVSPNSKSGLYHTVNKIDLTNISSIVLDGYINVDSGVSSEYCSLKCFTSIPATYWAGAGAATLSSDRDATRHISRLDVSNLTGSYYISLCLWHNAEAKVYQLYLEE